MEAEKLVSNSHYKATKKNWGMGTQFQEWEMGASQK